MLIKGDTRSLHNGSCGVMALGPGHPAFKA